MNRNAYRASRNRSLTSHSVRTKPSTRQPGSVSTTSTVSPSRSAVAQAEGDLVDPDPVDPRAVRAAEVGVDERPAAGLQPAVLARDPRVGEDEAVVARSAERRAACRRPRSCARCRRATRRGAARGSRAAPAAGRRASACRRRGRPGRPPRGRRAAPGWRTRRSGSTASSDRVGRPRWASRGAAIGRAGGRPARRSAATRRGRSRRGTALAGGGSTGAPTAWTGPTSTSTCPRDERRVGDERHARATGQVVGMGAGEGERGVGEPARERLGSADLAATSARSSGSGARDSGPGRRSGRPASMRARSIERSTRRSSWTGCTWARNRRARRALEDAFEETFDVGERGHGARHRTRGSRSARVSGTNGGPVRCQSVPRVPGPRWQRAILWPCPAGARPGVCAWLRGGDT